MSKSAIQREKRIKEALKLRRLSSFILERSVYRKSYCMLVHASGSFRRGNLKCIS